MRERPAACLRFIGLLGALLACSAAPIAAQAPAPKAAPRELTAEEQRAGLDAIQQIHQTLNAYRAAHPAPVARTPEEAADFEHLAAACKTLIDKYANSEVEAKARMYLFNACAYRGDQREAMEEIDALQTRFAGTRCAADACFEVGLDFLQRRNDPVSAKRWLEKIPMPAVPKRDSADIRDRVNYDEARKTWVSVQETIARCEVRLGSPADASARYDRMIALFPELKETLQRSMEFQVQSALSDPALKEFRPAFNAWLAGARRERADEEEKRWGAEAGGLRASVEMESAALRVGDPIVINVQVRNVSDAPVHLYCPTVYSAEQLVIRNEKGDAVKSRQTVDYDMPHPKEFFHLIKPGETFKAQMKGRAALKFLRAAEIPADAADRPCLLDFHDVACEIGRPGKFTASLRLTADGKTTALGKTCGFEPVWTGDLTSNVVEFTVRPMTREELDRAVAKLRDGSEAEKREAIEVVAANADRVAVRELMRILAAGTGPHLRAASDALVRIQDASVIPDLMELYKLSVKYPARDPGGVQSILLQTLRGLEADRAKTTELFLEVLKSDASVEARSTAARELGMQREPRVIEALIEAAKKHEPRMQYAAIDVLGNIGCNLAPAERGKVSAPLVEIMKGDPDSSVRGRAASALGQAGDGAAVPALVEALKDKDAFVGSYAAHALGRLAGPETIPALEAYGRYAETQPQKDAAKRAIDNIRLRANIKP